jgi:4-hydroxybenzoate polyprenyltransferase
MKMPQQLLQYAYLMRLNKPIGIFLLLWPTLWALWLASDGHPNPKICIIFVLGIILMRSAGCVVNDFADRHFDGFVKRTQSRPLVTHQISATEAIILALSLCFCAFLLVLQCNVLTILLSFIGVGLAWIYPFLKRVTNLPQVGLGLAFSWGIPMAFAAENGELDISAWFLFLASIIWPIIYDTMYAMIDREDDIKIGVGSTAILFNNMDAVVIGLLQLLFVVLLSVIGLMYELRSIYYVSIVMAGLLFLYQQWLLKERDYKNYFSAFLNNNWVGLIIFMGIVLSYMQ